MLINQYCFYTVNIIRKNAASLSRIYNCISLSFSKLIPVGGRDRTIHSFFSDAYCGFFVIFHQVLQ